MSIVTKAFGALASKFIRNPHLTLNEPSDVGALLGLEKSGSFPRLATAPEIDVLKADFTTSVAASKEWAWDRLKKGHPLEACSAMFHTLAYDHKNRDRLPNAQAVEIFKDKTGELRFGIIQKTASVPRRPEY